MVAETQVPGASVLEWRHPAPCTCPGCGGALRKIADEVSETLDYVPCRFKVVRHIRETTWRATGMQSAWKSPITQTRLRMRTKAIARY